VGNAGTLGPEMAWKIVAILGVLSGGALLGAAIATQPTGESADVGHWYLLASGFGVLLVTGPVSWLAWEFGRPQRDAGGLRRASVATVGCVVSALLGVATVTVAEDRSTVTNCFRVSSSPSRACSQAVDFTSADTRAFIPLMLAVVVLFVVGFVIAASQASEKENPPA
jgi:hypothetical protein